MFKEYDTHPKVCGEKHPCVKAKRDCNQSGFFLQTFLVNVTFALKSEYDCYKDDASHCIDFKQYFLIRFHYSLTSDESYC